VVCDGGALGRLPGLTSSRIASKPPLTVEQPEAQSTSTSTPSRKGTLADRIDDSFADLDLAVAQRAQLAQRIEAALHPFVVDAARRPMRVDLVQLGRLLLERKRLFLEQHVVLVE